MLILACRTKRGITFMEGVQRRSSSDAQRRLLSFFLLFSYLSSPLSLSLHPPTPLCLCLLLRAAKSVMVTALPCPTVGVEGSSRPFDTHALASRVLGRCSVLHPGSPHLSSGPWWGDTPPCPSFFPDEHTGLLPSTRAALSCGALNDSLLLPRPKSAYPLYFA